MSHNTKYYRKKLKKTESSKKIDVLFRQQALASENSANITPKQTEKVEASAEIAESSASTKNCPSTSTGVPGLQIRVLFRKNILIFLKQNICCEYSKEPS